MQEFHSKYSAECEEIRSLRLCRRRVCILLQRCLLLGAAAAREMERVVHLPEGCLLDLPAANQVYECLCILEHPDEREDTKP